MKRTSVDQGMNGQNPRESETLNIEYAYTFDYKQTENNNVTRDDKNRSWFTYPLEWRTANIKDKYVGFRSFWIAKSTRIISFEIELYDQNKALKATRIVLTVLNEKDDLVSLIEKTKSALGEYAQYFDFLSATFRRPISNYVYNGKNYTAWNNETKNILDDLEVSKDKYYSIGFILYRTSVYKYFKMTNLTDDVKGLFNAQDFREDQPEPYQCLFFYNLWNLHSCMIKSSLVNSTMNNYLGYSNKDYQPVKWYKITNNDERFYIDLFNGHSPELNTILPYDNMDHITLELVFKY
jgi:hypothetical protein